MSFNPAFYKKGENMSLFAEYLPDSTKNNNKPPLPNPVIRLAVESDAGQLAHLCASRDGGSPEEYRLKFYKEISKIDDHANNMLLVAEIQEKIVGFARTKYFTPPENSPQNTAPEGWYLNGIIIDPQYRRMGIASRLTENRLKWLTGKTHFVFYFANARNAASIDLHEKFGFHEITRDFIFPGVTFEGGVGILFRADLIPQTTGKGCMESQ